MVPVALWLWMARACGRGRNWARIVSTVLFGVATLDLTGPFGWPRGFHGNVVPAAFGPAIPVLYWLAGLIVVWPLWPGLPGVLQAAGLHAGPAPGTDGRTRADPVVQGADAASRVRAGRGVQVSEVV